MSDNANDASEATSAISEFQRPASGGRLPEVDNTSQPKYGSMSGMWIFGGLSASKKPLNDLYLVQPHFHRNIKYLTRNTSTYKKQASKNKVRACTSATK